MNTWVGSLSAPMSIVEKPAVRAVPPSNQAVRIFSPAGHWTESVWIAPLRDGDDDRTEHEQDAAVVATTNFVKEPP